MSFADRVNYYMCQSNTKQNKDIFYFYSLPFLVLFMVILEQQTLSTIIDDDDENSSKTRLMNIKIDTDKPVTLSINTTNDHHHFASPPITRVG